jgi:hypothetical protein
MRPHVLGKLLKYVGVDRVCYGTDCVMGGSPNGQIMAMRRFVIPEAMQMMYGYPAITDEIRRKIFGSERRRRLRHRSGEGPLPGPGRRAGAAARVVSSMIRDRCPCPTAAATRDRARGDEFFAFLRKEQQHGHGAHPHGVLRG